MAEPAALAAPSTSAPAASEPVDSGAASPNPADVRAASEPDTTIRLARPIKPIPRLPGVAPDDDSFITPSEPSQSDAGRSAASPPRGPDGRFLASSPADPSAIEGRTLEPGTDPAETPPPSKYKFAGEEFESQAAAEQHVRSLKGQFKPLQAIAREVGGLDKIQPVLTKAAESARGWKAEHDRVKAELDAYRSGQSPTPTQPQPEPAKEADLDWDLYAEVKRLADAAGEPWKAEKYLIDETRKLERARIDKMLDERDAPIRAQQAQAAAVEHIETLFGTLADYSNEDGSPSFPELADEATAGEVGRLWRSLDLPPEAALTYQGAVAAVGLYRMLHPARSADTSQPPAPIAPAIPPPPSDAHAASALSGGRPTVASVPGAGAPSAEAARIIAGLRSVHKNERTGLGFDA